VSPTLQALAHYICQKRQCLHVSFIKLVKVTHKSAMIFGLLHVQSSTSKNVIDSCAWDKLKSPTFVGREICQKIPCLHVSFIKPEKATHKWALRFGLSHVRSSMPKKKPRSMYVTHIAEPCFLGPRCPKKSVFVYKRPMTEPYGLARIITGVLYIHRTYGKRPMKET